MTKECNSNQLCIIDNYAQWDRQTDPQTDNARTRLNGPQGPFSENILHERNLPKKVILYFFLMLFDNLSYVALALQSVLRLIGGNYSNF